MNKQILAVIILAIIVSATVAAAGTYYYFTRSSPQPEENVVLIGVRATSGIPMQVMQNLQLDKKYGLNVTYLKLSDFDVAVTTWSIRPNAIVFNGGPDAIASFRDRGSDGQIAGLAGLSTAYIVVPTDSPIKTFADLKGKTLGIFQSPPTYYDPVLMRLASKNGFSWTNDVTVKPAPQLSMIELMNSKQIDAAFVTGFSFIRILARGTFRVLLDLNEGYQQVSGQSSRLMTSGINIHEVWAKEHPTAVKNVVKMWYEAVQWIKDHPDEAVTIAYTANRVESAEISQYPTTSSLVKQYFFTWWATAYDSKIADAAIQYCYWLQEIGIMETVPPDLFTTDYTPT